MQFFLVAVCFSLCTIVTSEEACHEFAGGSVYPQEAGKASGHALQWTKAMSELSFMCNFTW